MITIDTVPAVPKLTRIAVVLCAAASLSGCGHGTPAGSAAAAPAPGTPSAATSHPSVIRSLRPVAKPTSACALLSAAELKALLGGGASRTKVTATEGKHDKTSYTCEYGSGGKKPFALIVDGSDVRTFTPKDAIDAVAKAAHVKTRRLKGVGTAAVFYVAKDGYGVIAASKRSHGQTRSVFFSAPEIVPERKFADVARLVISRI